MVVRVRSLAALSVALSALPVISHADVVNTPAFDCPSGGTLAGINWGDNTGFNSVSIVPEALLGSLPAVQFGCSGNGTPNYTFKFDTEIKGITPNEFTVDFGSINTKWKGTVIPSFDTVNDKVALPVSDSKTSITDYFTKFDLYLNFFNVDGFLDHKDFVGVQVESQDGFSTGTKWFVDNANGEYLFDPTIPGNNTVVTLTNTPAVPEPSSFLLMGSGLAAAVEVLRRKRRK